MQLPAAPKLRLSGENLWGGTGPERGAYNMVKKQQLVEMMIRHPERVGRYFFRVGERVIFTVTKESVEWSPNRKLRWPIKKQIRHTSFLMPAEVPAVSDPSVDGWYFDRVAEEVAEKMTTHSMRGSWQQKVAKSFGLDPNAVVYTGYKVVGVKDGRFLSLYDGTTEYKIGEKLEQTARKGHQGGYYVLESSYDFMSDGNIPLPADAALRRWPHRAVLKVEFGGKVVRYKNKLAASWLRPLYVVRTICC